MDKERLARNLFVQHVIIIFLDCKYQTELETTKVVLGGWFVVWWVFVLGFSP